MKKLMNVASHAMFVLLTSLCFVSISIWAQDEAADHGTTATKVETIEGVTEYTLSNGLRVVLLPDPTSENITVNITYLVGSRDEGYGERGIAHLVEHLLFKGSENHPNITKELADRGTAPNGSTWLDRTNYFETFIATRDNLDWALDLEADRMINSIMDPTEIEKERTVVRNEWELSENSQSQVLSQRIRSVAFDWHSYGHSTIGSEADIMGIPDRRLLAFYKKYYQPDNAVLFVAGKIDEQETLDLILEKFGPIPRPERTGEMEILPNYSEEIPRDGERMVTLERIGDVQMVRYAYHVPGISHEDASPLSALAWVMYGSGVNSRLYQRLIETELASGAYAYSEGFKYPGLFWISATVPLDKSVEVVESEIEKIIQELKDNPPTGEEINRIKTSWANSYENTSTDVHALVRSFTNLAGNGDWRLYFVNRERSKELTAEAVQAVAQKYLVPSNRTRGYFEPLEETPSRVAVERADFSTLISKYEFEEEGDFGEVFEYSYDNLAKRVDYRTLSNGTKVAFVPKKNTGGTVSLSATMRWGNVESLMDKSYIASFTGAMMGRGTTKFSKQELADKRTELRLNGGVGVGLNTGSFSVSTIRDNLVESIRLVAHIAKEPAFPEDEFALVKTANIDGIEANRTNPQALLGIAMGKHLNQYPVGHPHYVSDLDEDLAAVQAVTLDDCKKFYSEFVGFGPNTTLTVVGDFDPDEIFAVLEEEFGDWISPAEYARIDQVAQSQPGIFLEIDTPDKTSAIMSAQFDFEATDLDADYEALSIAGRIFGGGFISSRLGVRIRQDEGLSYSVYGGFSGANPVDKYRFMFAAASVNPNNMDKVVAVFKEEVIKAIEDGFTDEEVHDAIVARMDSAQRSRANDGWIANTLHSNMFWGRDMEFHKARDARYESLTTDEVNEAFRKWVSVEKFTIAIVGDMSKRYEVVEETYEDDESEGQ